MNFEILDGNDITVRSLNVYGNPMPIVPPDECRCISGMRRYSRFFYIVSGEIVFDKGTDRELYAHTGDILYLPYDIAYYSEWLPGHTGSFLTANFIINSPSCVFSDSICVAVHDSTGRLLRLFRKLLDTWTKGAIHTELRTLAVFLELLSEIRNEASRKKLADGFSDIYEGIMYIENKFYEEFSVDELCRICNVSPATFRRKFLKYSGFSPVIYRNRLRCQRARELLESGEYTVTEAAMSVGFYDSSYFNRNFRRVFGINPSELLKK